MAKVKPASGIGPAKAFRANASGLVKPKGFDAEFNAKPQHSAGVVTPQSGQQAPGSAPLPWDGIAEGQVATAQNAHANSAAQIASNRALGLSEFGLDPGYNDYKANPYSQAAILQHNHESNERGINTTAGQTLYSGQTGNAQAIDRGRTLQAHQGLEGEESRAKAGWIAEEKAAEIAEQEAINAAKEGAVGRAAEAYNPEVPIGGGGSGGGGSSSKGPDPHPTEPAGAGKKWVLNSSGHWHRVKA